MFNIKFQNISFTNINAWKTRFLSLNFGLSLTALLALIPGVYNFQHSTGEPAQFLRFLHNYCLKLSLYYYDEYCHGLQVAIKYLGVGKYIDYLLDLPSYLVSLIKKSLILGYAVCSFKAKKQTYTCKAM
jgi:hypothetical protein